MRMQKSMTLWWVVWVGLTCSNAENRGGWGWMIQVIQVDEDQIQVDEDQIQVDEDQIQVDEDDPLYEAPPPPPPPPPDPRLQITPDDKYHNKHWMVDWAQKLTKASIQFWPPEAFQINQRNYWQKLTGRILSWPGQIMRLKVHIVWWPKLCWWWTTVIKVWRCDCNATPSLFLIQNLIHGSFPKGIISGQSIIDHMNWNVFVCIKNLCAARWFRK